MSIEFYKVMHLIGIMMVFMSLGAVSLHVVNAGTKDSNTFGKGVAITHGVGLTLILVAGFGLLAKHGWSLMASAWVWPKLLIWFIFGGVTVILYRQPASGKILWFVLPLLGLVAAYLAIVKPF